MILSLTCCYCYFYFALFVVYSSVLAYSQHPDYAAFDHAFDTKRADYAALRSEYAALL